MATTLLSQVLVGLLLVGSTFPALQAQNEVQFQLLLGPTPLQAGQEHAAVVRATMAEGWHLYSMTPYPPGSIAPQPTTIKLDDSPVFSLAGPVTQPRPHISHDENFGIDTEYFEGQVDFTVPLKVAGDAPRGEHELAIKVRYMACNDRLCLPPQTVPLTQLVTVQAAPAGSLSAAASPNRPPPSSPAATDASAGEAEDSSPQDLAVADPGALPVGTQRELPSGTLAYIWFAMAMGGLALLTPCVFPMIPITVSFFTKRDVSRRRAVMDAGLYAFGIVLTFTLIGFLLTALFGAGGINRVATSPLVNLLIAGVFVVFALSLFGVMEIGVPSSWLTVLDRKSSTIGGPVGIMLMALTFSLTSFTCTVPFVGTVMVAATQGDWMWSLLGVAAFATVFAAPFFVLAVFPSFLKSLPRSGGWMDSLKITMGFLELAAAMKFFSNVDLVYQWELITRPVFITVWLAIALVTGIYLLGKFRFPHESPVEAVGAGRVLSATFFLAVGFYLFRGLFGFPLGELDAFLPPRDYGEVASFQLAGAGASGEEGLSWESDYQAALKTAQETGKPVFIDFTGYLCTNCRWMEANIFPRPEVQQLLQQYVRVRLYTDGPKTEHEANLQFEKERFGTIALPLYAVMSPDDEIIATFPGLSRAPQEFVDFLEAGLRKNTVVAKAGG